MTNLNPSEKALVPFVSVHNMMKLIHHIGVEPMLVGLGDYIEADFRRWELFDKTPRVASHSEKGVIELMPTSDGDVYGFKYVNGHPSNTADGLQTVTAFGLLANVANGYPVLLSEMTILTALRTAATSAVVARLLAPKGANVMAMIGNGACLISTLPRRRNVRPIWPAKGSRSWPATPPRRQSWARRSSPPAPQTSNTQRS